MTPIPDAPPAGEALETKQRVRDRLMRERQRRLLRNSLVVVAISGVMLYVALAQRDVQARRRIDAEGSKIAAIFQAALDEQGTPARNFPVRGRDLEYLQQMYTINAWYPEQLQSVRPVGVAVVREPERMYLKPLGRVVILFDGAKYSFKWMSESEYQAERATLGFPRDASEP